MPGTVVHDDDLKGLERMADKKEKAPSAVLELPLSKIKPGKEQPRKQFDEARIAGLAESLKRVGLVQPIKVRKTNGGYTVVAGEQRVRAAKLAGWKTIQAIEDTGDDGGLVTATVENVARVDLNPIEEGDAYTAIAAAYAGDPKQVAELVGRTVEHVNFRMALARLPEKARQAIIAGTLPLQAAVGLAGVNDQNRTIAEVLAHAAAGGAFRWSDLTDPWRCMFELDRYDPTRNEEECSACEATGETEEGDECGECKGTGVIVTENKDAEPLPEFFAVPIGRYSGELDERMIAQLPDEARERITTQKKRADDYDTAQKKKSQYYYGRAPQPTLDGDEIQDAAVATGCALMFRSQYGQDRVLVTDPAFVAEYLPDMYERAVDEYVAPKKRDGTAKKPKESMTAKELAQAQEESEARAKERAKAEKERVAGRQFNADLGVALARVGEVKVTTEAMKLLAGAIIAQTRRNDYGGRKGEGVAMWQRYTRTDWPTNKQGQPVIPRSAADREAFAKKVDKQVDLELSKAKSPEQVLGVLVRYLGHQLADLRGLPNADLDGSFTYGDHMGFRAFVLKHLPAGLRKRTPKGNGIPGRSYSWSD